MPRLRDFCPTNVLVLEVAERREAQLLNFLKASPGEVGLLLNIGSNPEVSRKVLDYSCRESLGWIENTDLQGFSLNSSRVAREEDLYDAAGGLAVP